MTLGVRIAHSFSGFTLDVDFSLDEPGVTALFGPSGSGKTTIINTVAGLIRPREARVVVGRETLTDTSGGTFIPPRLRRMGYVFQEARLFPHLSVRHNLLYGWRRSASPASRAEIEHITELLGLGSLLARLPRNLSGGEKQRVALARAILAAPRLLLLDEPLAALDSSLKDEILPYLERLRDEMRVPMLYVSHSAQEVARLADYVILLEKGQITAKGSVFDLFSSLAPEARALSAGSVIEARVTRHMTSEQMSELDFGDGRVLVPIIGARVGARVRLRIYALDITIALDAPGRISANNVLSVVVGDIAALGNGEANVQLICGETRLVAQITEHSLKRLQLARGLNAFAIVKSVTVDRRRETRRE